MLKNANEKHNVNNLSNIVNLFRKGGNFFRNRVDLFRFSILRKVLFLRQGVLSLFSRSSVGGMRQGIREVKEMAILIKVLFYVWDFFGRSLVYLWFFVGL